MRVAPVIESVDVAIVCALDLEADAIVRHLRRHKKTIGSGFTITCGTLSSRPVAVVRSEPGRKRIAAAADAVLHVHRPRCLIAAGFAIGLDATLRRGDVLVASEIVNDAGDREPISDTAVAVATRVAGANIGRLVSVSSLPRTVSAKRELLAKTVAVAADQQSMTLARISSERGVRFLAVRVLVDDATRDAAPESRAVYHPSASFRAGGVVGALMSGSGHVSRIWKIRAEAKRHANRLAEFLARLVPSLP
jgi:nucleoside phosphorylase